MKGELKGMLRERRPFFRYCEDCDKKFWPPSRNTRFCKPCAERRWKEAQVKKILRMRLANIKNIPMKRDAQEVNRKKVKIEVQGM